MADDPLTTYLSDHLAGSVGASELIEREIERNDDPRLVAFLEAALEQIRNDQQILRGILEKRGVKESVVRDTAAWLLERARRLKIADGSHLERMQALEFLVLGMHGRFLLWTALEGVAQIHPQLQALDFTWLKHRALEHHDEADRFRIEAARAVFAESLGKPDAAREPASS